jgi:mono/diheme cytochrome c family protein
MIVPKPFVYIGVSITVLALIPPAVIAYARAGTSAKPRLHMVLDMDNQLRFESQHANSLFRDGRAMRPVVEGTVARGELNEDEHLHRGVVNDAWATTFPSAITLDRAFVEFGRERFNIYCTPCHGLSGYGDGAIHHRAMEVMLLPTSNGTSWVQPKSIHEQAIREQPVGQVFNTITNGVRTMAGYDAQVPVKDRWAIVAYVKALQRSQNALESDVPDLGSLRTNDYRPATAAAADDAAAADEENGQ